MKKIALVIILVAAVVAVGIFVTRTTEPDTRVAGLVPGAVEPFGARPSLDPGPFDARFNRLGSHLAVRGETGVSLADEGKLRRITERGLAIAAYAWLPSSDPVIIYAEAPGSTGRLRLVEADGDALGFVPLEPVVRVRAISVATDRRHAVLVVSERETLATKDRLDLVAADLKEGTVTPLPKTDADELDVRHVDDGRVVLRVATDTGAEAVLLDLETGERTRLSRAEENVEHVDVLATGQFVGYAARTPDPDGELGPAVVWAVRPDGGAPQSMGEAGDDTVVAIHPRGGLAVVAELVAETDSTFARRLRRVTLGPLPDPPESSGG